MAAADYSAEFECSNGHYISIAASSPADSASKTVGDCPVRSHGRPCDGTVKRIGRGSRSLRKEEEA